MMRSSYGMFGLVWYWYVIYASGNNNTPYVDDHHQLALGELQLFRFCHLQQHHIIILTLIYSSSILFSRFLHLHSDHNLYNLYPLSTLYPSISRYHLISRSPHPFQPSWLTRKIDLCWTEALNHPLILNLHRSWTLRRF